MEALMRRSIISIAVAPILFAVSVTAWAGTLHTKDGKEYSGSVLSIEGDSIKFLWQKQKDQSAIIKSGDADELFRAEGQRTVARVIPLSNVLSIDGIPTESYRAMYSYNGFYRTFEEFGSSGLLVTAKGGFLHQIKAVLIFLALIFVLTPLALMLVAIPAGSERLGYLGGAGMVVLLTILGMGCVFIAKATIGLSPFMATPAAQVMLTVLFILILAFVVNFSTRFTFWQGLAFSATWCVCLIAIGRITTKIVDLPV